MRAWAMVLALVAGSAQASSFQDSDWSDAGVETSGVQYLISRSAPLAFDDDTRLVEVATLLYWPVNGVSAETALVVFDCQHPGRVSELASTSYNEVGEVIGSFQLPKPSTPFGLSETSTSAHVNGRGWEAVCGERVLQLPVAFENTLIEEATLSFRKTHKSFNRQKKLDKRYLSPLKDQYSALPNAEEKQERLARIVQERKNDTTR